MRILSRQSQRPIMFDPHDDAGSSYAIRTAVLLTIEPVIGKILRGFGD
jgi:hypothetical protein